MGRVICAFQPHTYSRTHELFSDFVEVLKLPDQVLLAEIFAAREQNELGISSRDLAEQIPGAEFCPGVEQVAERAGPAGPAGGPDFDRGEREISSEPESCCWPDKRRARPETEKEVCRGAPCAPLLL